MKRDGNNISLWQGTAKQNGFESEGNKITRKVYDVVIAGAGITGITTGLLLLKKGKSVLIAEANTIGFGTTGGTTAHLNTFMDTPYYEIEKKFSPDDAKLVAKAVVKALNLIKQNVTEYNIDCGYEQQMAFLYAQNEDQAKELETIIESSERVGVAAVTTSAIPIPVPFQKAAMFEGQAKFHPARYLYALAQEFKQLGGTILENCRVMKVDEEETLVIHTNTDTLINAVDLIYATHIPPGINMLHFRCAPYRSYAMAVKLADNNYPDGLIYDMYDPYHYFRTQEIDGEQYLIAGGEDHKTAHEENTHNCFLRLEAYLKKYFAIESIPYKWSSQYFEATDGLPYIGQLPVDNDHIYVATGYGGNGMVYSGVAAQVLTDMIIGNKSEFEELFDPGRIKIVAGFSNFIKENADVSFNLIKSIFPPDKLEILSELALDEARVIKYENQTIAIYKGPDGDIHSVNPTCTHLKCTVAWNSEEKSWDCPCHGARYDCDGNVLTGPAVKNLQPVEISKPETSKFS